MEKITAQITGNSFSKISQQQAHELRILVFHKVYEWFDMLTTCGVLGVSQTDNDLVFLEGFSLQQVRAYFWELFGEEFGGGAEVEELPRNQYKEARRYLKGITLATLRCYIETKGSLATVQEMRPREDILARRYIESVNINRAQRGYPPLKYRGKVNGANA